MFKEQYAIILDFLASGYAGSFRKEPIAQALGEEFFTLLELVPKDVTLRLREKVYIGPDKRDKIQFVKGRLDFEKLTVTARNELTEIVEELVRKNEEKYVDFFNKTGPISVRQHSLELLPNIGKKHMLNIISEREKNPFKSYEDIKKRVNLMPDPARVLTERIIEEISGKTKYHLFARGGVIHQAEV